MGSLQSKKKVPGLKTLDSSVSQESRRFSQRQISLSRTLYEKDWFLACIGTCYWRAKRFWNPHVNSRLSSVLVSQNHWFAYGVSWGSTIANRVCNAIVLLPNINFRGISSPGHFEVILSSMKILPLLKRLQPSFLHLILINSFCSRSFY